MTSSVCRLVTCGVAVVGLLWGCRSPAAETGGPGSGRADAVASKPGPGLQGGLTANPTEDGARARLTLSVTPERQGEALEVEFLLPEGVTPSGGATTRIKEMGPTPAGQVRVFSLEVDLAEGVRKQGADVMAAVVLHLRGANKDTINLMARVGPPATAATPPKAGVVGVDNTGEPVRESPAASP